MMAKYPYDQLDFHFTVQDDLADDDLIIAGYAIRSEDKGSFLFDLKGLVEKYGGAGYDELLDNDEGDASLDAALKRSMGQ